MAADDLGDHGRFNDPSLLVMSSLADGPKHGYAMTKDIQRFAGVILGPGTLYGALARLQHQGLIEALPADDRRRPYRLSDQGAKLLAMLAAGVDGAGTYPTPFGPRARTAELVRSGLAELRDPDQRLAREWWARGLR